MDHVYKYFSDILPKTLSSKKTFSGDYRLDPNYYSTLGNIILNHESKPLEEYCDLIFNPNVFKREFQESKQGCRYLASAEIVSNNPDITFISNEQADTLNIRVKEGWVLVTGFGTIGSVRIVDATNNGFAVANNVARIIPKHGMGGFIAAYLQSPLGNQLLNDYAAGAVVKYIEAAQIARIPIPIINDNIITKIHEQYLSAVTHRETAEKQLIEADTLVHNFNNLPILDITNAEFYDPAKKIQTRILESSHFPNDYRLDAHFYSPIAELAIRNITQYGAHEELSSLTNKIIIARRFKRNYVESEFGTPFLSGKNISQIRPIDLKHLSTIETSFLKELLIEQNWILITCSGTIGRTCFVYRNYENYAASQHILRIVANEDKIDPGYLYAFLSSNYGYQQILRFRYGSVIDEIDEVMMGKVIVPLPRRRAQQSRVGDLVRMAYENRAKAIQLEDEAQELLNRALTN